MDDSIIVVDDALGKIIGEVICDEIKESRSKNGKVYKLAERCERQYSQITSFMADGKECDNPWPGAADYFVPMSEWIIDAMHARIMNVLFSQEPYMTAKGTEAADVERAPGVTDFVDTILRETVKLRENMSFFLKQILKIPTAILKYEWVEEHESLIIKEKAIQFINPLTGETQELLKDDPELQGTVAQLMANGYQPAPEEVEVYVKKDVPISDAPKLKYINFSDYVWSPSAKRGNRIYWEGDRFYLTINEMRAMVNDEKFIEASVNRIIADSGVGDKSGAEKVISERETQRECYYWYGRLPFNDQNEIDLTDNKAMEQEVICIVDYKSKELVQIKHWDYERIPNPDRVYIRGEFEETEGFEGRSMLQKLYMTQKYINQFYNTLMNNAWLAMQKVFVRKNTSTENLGKINIYPGKVIDIDMQGDFTALEVGDVKAIGLEINANLINFGERISNISVYQTGTKDNRSGQKTYGEVAATIQEGNIGMDKLIQNCHSVLRKICQWTVDYYYERMPPGLERKIMGDNGEPLFPTEQNMPMYQEKGIQPEWSRDDLKGKFDYTWNGTSLNSSVERNIALSNDLMQNYLPQPMVQGSMLATWEILRDGLVARQIKDWQKILPKREAIIAEMERMAQEAQQEEAMKRNGGAMGGASKMIVKKLGEQGIPEPQAIKMIQDKVGGQNNAPAKANNRPI
jgi:hypothetical protein